MKIKGILTIYTSIRDRNGNCYHAAQWIDTQSGAITRFGSIGGPGNMNGIGRLLGIEWDAISYSERLMGYRDFQSLTKDWPYHCAADESAVLKIKASIKAARKAAKGTK